jgi:hypothetical protein
MLVGAAKGKTHDPKKEGEEQAELSQLPVANHLLLYSFRL